MLFYTNKLPADAAQKKLIVDYIEEHFPGSASKTAAMPRRVAAPDEMDG